MYSYALELDHLGLATRNPERAVAFLEGLLLHRTNADLIVLSLMPAASSTFGIHARVSEFPPMSASERIEEWPFRRLRSGFSVCCPQS